MMFEQDYILRQIEEFIAVLMKMFFGREIDTQKAASQAEHDGDAEKLRQMIDCGNIREAESALYNSMKAKTASNLLKGYCFYQYLAQKDDDFLETHSYSRVMLTDGLRRLASVFGAPHLADIFYPV